ncbi:hypothetical protein DL95DRAFT_411876 [Leptodontidium sp. 2 PMI_412]|nr:hypothetical protein DL95DRAFT_411876 [Leptodontidium sp. 2 PMI_412]
MQVVRARQARRITGANNPGWFSGALPRKLCPGRYACRRGQILATLPASSSATNLNPARLHNCMGGQRQREGMRATRSGLVLARSSVKGGDRPGLQEPSFGLVLSKAWGGWGMGMGMAACLRNLTRRSRCPVKSTLGQRGLWVTLAVAVALALWLDLVRIGLGICRKPPKSLRVTGEEQDRSRRWVRVGEYCSGLLHLEMFDVLQAQNRTTSSLHRIPSPPFRAGRHARAMLSCNTTPFTP